MNEKPITVAVSGGFDPIHIGHVRYLQEAKKLGDRLVVIINNDNWLQTKKGKNFMNEQDRKEILEAFECVDEVIITKHSMNDSDKSVCKALEKIMPHIFANGGDRFADDIPEFIFCNEHNIKMEFNVGHGGKVRSSSELLADYHAE
ncbi:MAG: adenylyltransferase/cytidyltransferase family protein [Candidatus Pacebacteria bacterium]|nr:adenylyltransferase/cytidyltransferase family protein [Candidatus Paceibacterota bacterium]